MQHDWPRAHTISTSRATSSGHSRPGPGCRICPLDTSAPSPRRLSQLFREDWGGHRVPIPGPAPCVYYSGMPLCTPAQWGLEHLRQDLCLTHSLTAVSDLGACEAGNLVKVLGSLFSSSWVWKNTRYQTIMCITVTTTKMSPGSPGTPRRHPTLGAHMCLLAASL